MKLVVLEPKKKDPHPAPCQATIDLIKDLLKQAESGEVQSLVFACTHFINGEEMTGTGLSIQGGTMALLGSLEYAKSRVLTFVEH